MFEPEKISKIIGSRIAEVRKSHKENQADFAKKVEISRASISNIEAGRQQITISLLYKIAYNYKIEIASLIPPVTDFESEAQEFDDKVTRTLEKQQVGDKTKTLINQLIQKG